MDHFVPVTLIVLVVGGYFGSRLALSATSVIRSLAGKAFITAFIGLLVGYTTAGAGMIFILTTTR